MTIPNVSAGATIDPVWGNAVADQLNDLPLLIEHAEVTTTADGSGQATFNFTSSFAATPTLVCTGRSTLDRFLVVNSISASSFTVTLYDLSSGSFVGGSTIIANYVALGTPA